MSELIATTASDEEIVTDEVLQSDAALVRRCVQGEVSAWDELFAACHEPLVAAIRVMLSRWGSDEALVDEMASRVWYVLVTNDGKQLAKYNVRRKARLITFLRAVARTEIHRHFRAESRRRGRELTAFRDRGQVQREEGEFPAAHLSEFLRTLTSRELAFYESVLLADSNGSTKTGLSSSNIRQLTHRVYRKLQKFLGYAE